MLSLEVDVFSNWCICPGESVEYGRPERVVGGSTTVSIENSPLRLWSPLPPVRSWVGVPEGKGFRLGR